MQRFLVALAVAAIPVMPAAAAAFSDQQRADIVEIIRQALKADPSILRDAVAALQAADERTQKQTTHDAILAARSELADDGSGPSTGNARGSVTIVEFFDVRCPYCRQIEATINDLLAQDHDVKLVFRDLPILGPSSVLGAKALLAAHRQGGNGSGAYVKLRTALMRPGVEPTRDSVRTAADAAGLDGARLLRDMDDPAIQTQIDANLKLAEKLDIHGTPALVVGGTLVPGAVSLRDLSQVVDHARHGGG